MALPGCDGQAGRGDVDAQHHGAGAQALHRQRIVDFGGLRVVDGIGLHRRPAAGRRWLRRCQRRKAGALGEVVEQKALPVELVGRVDGAGLLQQIQRRSRRGALASTTALYSGAFLSGEQDLVQLLADRLRAAAGGQLGGPVGDQLLDDLFLLDRGQRLLQDLGRAPS
jgi:hypothetical protein